MLGWIQHSAQLWLIIVFFISSAQAIFHRGVRPQILVRPEAITHVRTGVTFVLSCQAIGSPTPTVTWFKNGRQMAPNVSRVAVFESGYLLISQARESDSADYKCGVTNSAGSDAAQAKVIVTAHSSGCADDVTDALERYEEIQACGGAWQGHVKRARSLCASGWRVCTNRDAHLLSMVTWADIMSTQGCYAYNAANTMNKCSRCWKREMLAGLGAGCSRIRRSHKSCLAQGRIDVFRGPRSAGCQYKQHYTDGVVCCKRRTRRNRTSAGPVCRPKCQNGGRCVQGGQCACADGYKGVWCQNAICNGGCIPNSTCARPGVCVCKMGHVGRKCRKKINKPPRRRCKKLCLNGGKCFKNRCKCIRPHFGSKCQHIKKASLKEQNRTE